MKRYFLALCVFSVLLLSAQTEVSGKYSDVKSLEINTKNSDFGPSYLGENQLVFASPKKGFRVIRDVWEQNGQRFLELYTGTINNETGEISDQQKLKGEVNSRYHEAQVAFTKDGKTVYFTRDNYYNKILGVSNTGFTNLAMFKASINSDGEWINIIPMPFNNVEYSVGHPALSDDGKTLYFASDMPGSLGETDIFKVDVNLSGFGNPTNLGEKVNSTAKDWFPFVDGEVLYFTSDRTGGKGGSDVYASKLVGFTPQPILLNEPINSSNDDFAFVINSETRKGYFSSNREGGKGDDDIYSFLEEAPIEFKCKQLITGEVRDKNTTDLLPGTEVVLSDKDGNVLETQIVKEDAVFSFEVMCETEYKLEGKKTNYTPQAKGFTTDNEADKENKLLILLGTGDIDFVTDGNRTGEDQEDIKPEGLPDVLPDEIVRLRAGTYAVNIDPIYFDFNSSYLNKQAKTELQKVVDLMNQYPKMIIESASHTDSRGLDGYNGWLSDRRAKSTVNYIIERGIDPTRITGKGYGSTQLINQCERGIDCTEAQHAANRRTEFVIIKM
jgi:outer membrane protein OmpA-like peptidoglycan-associated protein